MKTHYVHIGDKDLYQLLLAEERYSFPRDNGCVLTLTSHIKKYLPKMEQDSRSITAQQLIEEIIGSLKCPELNGGRKHRAIWLNPNTNAYRTVFISDYEYNTKKLISSLYTFDDLNISEDIVFEDEDYWRDLITYLVQYVKSGYVPYNDSDCKFYNWR